jgi:monofunctional glycosyltransferase
MKRWLKIGAVAFAVYLLWPYNIPVLRYKNPRTTSLIELRIKEARKLGRRLRPAMTWRSLSQISPSLTHAVLLAEDDTFYRHHGFDLQQILIAMHKNWSNKRYVYGGSTITQQLARTLYLRPKKSLLRKAKEAVLTLYLEIFLPKKRILELYLNMVEWGPGIFGAEAAAQHYFSKSALDLSSDEVISLASILPSPRRWSPFSEKAFMAERRIRLLERMQKAGYAPAPVSNGEGNDLLLFDPNSLPERE